MRDDFVAIALVVDRSGSMESVRDDTIGGINTFIQKHKEDKNGEIRVTIAQFDNEYKVVKDFVEIGEIKKFSRNNFRPRNSTALLDAIGKTVDDLGVKLASMKEEERPSKVIVGIITDGQENSSREYNVDDIRSRISHQQEVYSWEFIFMGADLNSVDVASSYGFNPSTCMAYDKRNIAKAFTTMADASIRSYHGGSMDFTEEERKSCK
jgi:uncharacterized protein YegL